MTTIAVSRRTAIMLIAAVPLALRGAAAASRPHMVVHKDPDCGCCDGWVAHVRRAGFGVTVHETSDLNPVKSRLGIPDALASCHTAELDGYVIEGHVPARAIERLLAERPQARGLAVPGMPAGSPGMGGVPEVYEVVLFGPAGEKSFGRFRADREV